MTDFALPPVPGPQNPWVRVRNGASRVVVDVPHSGTGGLLLRSSLPDPLRRLSTGNDDDVVQAGAFGCDVAVPQMSGYDALVGPLGLSCVESLAARIFTDVNRARDDLRAHGVYWQRTPFTRLRDGADARDLRNAALAAHRIAAVPDKEAHERAMACIYDPYHAALRRAHGHALALHGSCVHLALHSIPAVPVRSVDGQYLVRKDAAPSPRGPFDPVSGTLPDVLLIHHGMRSADEGVVRRVRRAFEEEGCIVSDGEGPFLGDTGVTALYGDPANGVHVIGIEHITHGVEIERLSGGFGIDVDRARAFRNAYRKVIETVLCT